MSEIKTKSFEVLSRYPEPIQNHIREILDVTFEIIDPSIVRSILLFGSTPRGELSYSFNGNELDIFSDYEFTIISNKGINSKIQDKLKVAYKKLEQDWSIRSPLFSIDFGVSQFFKWKLIPPTFWAFEAKNEGLTIYGEDLRDYLTNVTLDNLDFGNLNQLILIRLWNMLIHIPKGCILGQENAYERFTHKFYMARNILEILTIYLPNIGVLHSGYQKRRLSFSQLNENLFDKEEIDIINKSHELKLNCVDRLDYRETSNAFFRLYVKLACYVANVPLWDFTPENLDNCIRQIESKEIFDQSLKKKAIRVKTEFDIFLKKPGIYNLKWLLKNKSYDMFGLLLSLHAIFIDSYSAEQKQFFIKNAKRYLCSITMKDIDLEGLTLMDCFLEIRMQLLDFMMDWFYGRLNVSREEIDQLMNWRDER